MTEQLFRGCSGIVGLAAVALLVSTDRRNIPWRTVGGALACNILFAFLVLRTSVGITLFDTISAALLKIMSEAAEGSKFVFGPLYDGFAHVPGFNGTPFVFVLGALVPIIFFGALIQVCYHFGVMQRLIALMALVFRRLFGLSGPEATVVASNIFVGQVQGAMTVAPYLAALSEAELFQIMVVGMSTVGAGMPLVYAGMGGQMNYLLAANIMSAPAAVLFARIIVPGERRPAGSVPSAADHDTAVNFLDAFSRGAMSGCKVVVAISIMLLAFIPLLHLLDWLIVTASAHRSDLETVLTWLFTPAGYLVGVPSADISGFAKLLGQKTAFNEVIGFGGLKATPLSPKGFMLSCFALTGFANFTSIAIQIGGLGELAPDRRSDVARLGLRCVLAASLANLLNATIAGMLFRP